MTDFMLASCLVKFETCFVPGACPRQRQMIQLQLVTLRCCYMKCTLLEVDGHATSKMMRHLFARHSKLFVLMCRMCTGLLSFDVL